MKKIATPLGEITNHQKVLFLGSKRIDKNIALENLKVVARVMDKQGVKFGPIYGSLLGIIRDNDFITWDEDIDCYILKEEENNFLAALWLLEKEGFELVRYIRRGLYSIMRNGEYIDFYVLRSISPELRHMGGPDFVFEKYISDTITIDFKGVNLTIPRQYEEYLDLTYGDWRTPRQYLNFEDRGVRFVYHWMRMYIKDNLLPDFIYYRMLIRYHKKHLEEFKAKCKKRGLAIPEDLKLPPYNNK